MKRRCVPVLARGKKKLMGEQGRPKKKNAGVSHAARAVIGPKTAVHVTVRVSRSVPNLRARRRFSVIKRAFVKFCLGEQFRLVHFSVMSNHVHFVVEADSKRALSLGMQRVLHSISRRLNALSVWEHGATIARGTGGYAQAKGWLGRVFANRYHAHVLASPTEMKNAVKYVLTNAQHHYDNTHIDECSSLVQADGVAPAKGFLLARASHAIRKLLS